ncbi:hypothetical protein M404DRAFT_23377 [Pisolithus tinctorius Marx 270]|uniref:Uncharacterized protein n=1 Tax=Pisolithus tinctorius Marx 270 TaxID=870435 RepID=A0A0C3P4U7_PISTI|nr:hypothetical protein M404DRAFT_23377 [Pisolithus tinctorius Marx 270]
MPQGGGPMIQEDDGVPDDDLPDLESVSDDEDYRASGGITSEEEDPNEGICIYAYRSDQVHGTWWAVCLVLPLERVPRPDFDIVHWHAKRLFHACVALTSCDPLEDDDSGICALFKGDGNDETHEIVDQLEDAPCDMIQLNGVKVCDEDKLTLQRNSSIAKDFTRCESKCGMLVKTNQNQHKRQM